MLGQTKPQKIATCIFCCPTACCVPIWIDQWWSIEACCLSYLNCGRCCWTISSPVCFSCKLGDFDKGLEYCV